MSFGQSNVEALRKVFDDYRAIRLVVDVGMHWKDWTREDAIKYMMANEPISEEGAVAEVERYMAYTASSILQDRSIEDQRFTKTL